MAKSILEELASYRVKVEREGKEIVNVPGIVALPVALLAPKASIIGAIAAPLLGCNIHLENGDGKEIDVGKTVKDAADTVMDTAATAARSMKEEIEKAWDALSADDPEGCPEGQENAEEETPEQPAPKEEAPVQTPPKEEVPTIHVNPEDSEEK